MEGFTTISVEIRSIEVPEHCCLSAAVPLRIACGQQTSIADKRGALLLVVAAVPLRIACGQQTSIADKRIVLINGTGSLLARQSVVSKFIQKLVGQAIFVTPIRFGSYKVGIGRGFLH